jgi:hypothetical protein
MTSQRQIVQAWGKLREAKKLDREFEARPSYQINQLPTALIVHDVFFSL